MSQSLAELLILIPTVLNTGYLLFVATVLQGVMNEMDEGAFQKFVPVLLRKATRDPYTVITGTVTVVAIIPYFSFYGFTHWWYIACIFFFVVSSVSGKLLNLPAYARITGLTDGNPEQLRVERRKLQIANWLRGGLCMVAVVLMVIQFF